MTKIFLNLGHNLNGGLQDLRAHFGNLSLSSVYESEPVGFKGECFFNMAVALESSLSISEVSIILKKIEDRHGRIRGGKHFAPRTLDIDIVCYGDQHGIFDGVELPRAELYYNGFVLWPMAELAPRDIDIKTGLTYESLWLAKQEEIERQQKVWRIDFEC